MGTEKVSRPDDKTIKRMTVISLNTLLNSLRTQRNAIVQPLDDRIKMYEEILEEKKKEANGQATS